MGFRLPFLCRMVRKSNVNVLAVSYAGYGLSEGDFGEEEFYETGQAAWNWLTAKDNKGENENDYDPNKHDENDNDKPDPKKIFLMGRSIGGAVAVKLAVDLKDKEKLLGGVILENTFTSMADMSRSVFPFLKVVPLSLFDRLLTTKMRTDKLIPEVRCPIMFISGNRDTLVPPKQMTSLLAKSTKALLTHFVTVVGGTHNDTWTITDQYYSEIIKFIDKALEADKSTSPSSLYIISIPTRPPNQPSFEGREVSATVGGSASEEVPLLWEKIFHWLTLGYLADHETTRTVELEHLIPTSEL